MKISPGGARPDAFTLLEIMLVVAIISVLLGVGIYKMTGTTTVAREVATETTIKSISTQLHTYQIGAGHLPTTEQGLAALVERPNTKPVPARWTQLLEEMPTDSWNHPLFYIQPGKRNPKTFDLYSAGADGIENTEDDIGNWKPKSPSP